MTTTTSPPAAVVASPLLSVTNLSVRYDVPSLFRTKKPAVVRGVTFDIAPGETLGLVGESGSGKSTTGRAILRLLGVDDGSIVFDGTDITSFGRRTPLSYRKDVQAVFQDPSMSLNPRQPVVDAVTSPLQRHGVSDAAGRRRLVLEAFEHVGLRREHLDRYPAELSGGQQQRVAIARALVLKPRLVVCDEAVSALDLSTQNQILTLLSDLQAETGVSYLFIAHDLGMVRHMCDRIGVMRLGEMVELAESEELFRSPKHPYTRRLLGATPSEHPTGRDERRARRQKFVHLREDEGLVAAATPDERLEG